MSEENIRENTNDKEILTAAEQAPATRQTAGAAPTYMNSDTQVRKLLPSEANEDEKERRRQAVKSAVKGVSIWTFLPATFLLGVLVCEMMLNVYQQGIGVAISVAAAFALYTLLIVKRDRNRIRSAVMCAIPLALLALSFGLSASFSGRGLMLLSVIGLGMLTAAVMSGCTASANLFSLGTLRDALYVNTLAPISNIGPAFGAVFTQSREESEEAEGGSRAGSSAGKVFIGLLISVPLVIILIAAMTSADAMFSEFIAKALDWLEKQDIDAGRIIVDIIVGLIFCVFAVPLVLTLRSGYVKDRRPISISRRIDPIIAATVSYSATAVYLLFVIVQISYFFPVSISYYFEKYDFTQRLTLPNDMTWSEYARSGFFELSGIIIASFAAIALLMTFCRRSQKGDIPGYLKAALSVIAGCNVVMAVSAVMRMGLYTIWCGLTAKRIGVLMIIAVIAVSLIAVIIRLWAKSFPLVRVVAALAVCAMVCFGCMNVERICANVNVERHIEQGTSIDICYLGNLSYAAAPAVERLMNESPDEDIRAAAAGILAKYYYHGAGCEENSTSSCPISEWSFGDLTLDHLWAYNACRDENGKVWVTEDMIESYGRYAEWQDYVARYQRTHDEECPYDFEAYNAENTVWYYSSYSGR